MGECGVYFLDPFLFIDSVGVTYTGACEDLIGRKWQWIGRTFKKGKGSQEVCYFITTSVIVETPRKVASHESNNTQYITNVPDGNTAIFRTNFLNLFKIVMKLLYYS